MAMADAKATQRSSARAGRVIARPCLTGITARSLELIGDLVDAGLDAGFVLLAAGSAGDADRTDDVLADRDRQRATRGGKPGEILGTHLRILLQPLFHLARRNPEGARGESLLEAVLHGVRPGAVAADLDDNFSVAADNAGRQQIAVRRAGGDGGWRDRVGPVSVQTFSV